LIHRISNWNPAMTDSDQALERLAASDYKYGFVTDIEQETVPPGLNEDGVRLRSC